MKNTQNPDYSTLHFKTQYIKVAGIQTALHASLASENAPNLLFVHGFGGDYHGMIPLAYELKDRFNIYIVDLPGHGKSELPRDRSLAYVDMWSKSLCKAIPHRVDGIVTHSFGCYPAQFIGDITTFFINAPFTLSPSILKYSRIVYALRYIASLFYFFRPFAIWRGKKLVHNRSELIDYRIEWVTDQTKVTRKEFLYHADLTREMTDGRQLMMEGNLTEFHDGIVLSEYDEIATVSDQQKAWLSKFHMLTLPCDHLSIFEKPEQIADFIVGHMPRN